MFFDYIFAKSCYHDASLSFDVSQVLSTPERLLSKLKMSSRAETVKLLTVWWGIWFRLHKKVWEDKMVTAEISMKLSFYNVN